MRQFDGDLSRAAGGRGAGDWREFLRGAPAASRL